MVMFSLTTDRIRAIIYDGNSRNHYPYINNITYRWKIMLSDLDTLAYLIITSRTLKFLKYSTYPGMQPNLSQENLEISMHCG